jgi:hypothetical protein
MSKKKIKFLINKAWLNKDSNSTPLPSLSKNIPDWYRAGDRFAKKPDGSYWADPNDGGKIATWKACPAIYDLLGTGYVYRTPCDIEFKKINGRIQAKVLDSRYEDFLQIREEMPGFVTPHGYHKRHFAWFPDWSCSVPDGYSVLYAPPFNRYDLPFLTTSGIIDNDKVSQPGSMPFFLRDDFEGVLPAGTPYTQLIPFKREDWESEIVQRGPLEIFKAKKATSIKFRVKDGGVYQKEVWSRRKYE